MKELSTLLAQFRSCLELQLQIYQELIPVLDREEDIITRFNLAELEPIIIEKDQLIQRTSSAETRRIALFKKICALMGYDTRNETPSLAVFLQVFEHYLANVKTLIPPQEHEHLAAEYSDLQKTSDSFLGFFKQNVARLYRNQQVLEKLNENFAKSFSIFESANSYDDKKTKKNKTQKSSSTLQVRA